jgi:hypothetical protein
MGFAVCCQYAFDGLERFFNKLDVSYTLRLEHFTCGKQKSYSPELAEQGVAKRGGASDGRRFRFPVGRLRVVGFCGRTNLEKQPESRWEKPRLWRSISKDSD